MHPPLAPPSTAAPRPWGSARSAHFCSYRHRSGSDVRSAPRPSLRQRLADEPHPLPVVPAACGLPADFCSLGSGLRAPGSCMASSPSAMAAARGRKAAGRCSMPSLLLLLVVGPALGWSDPGKYRAHQPLPAACSPAGDHFRSLSLEPLYPNFSFPFSSLCLCALACFSDLPRRLTGRVGPVGEWAGRPLFLTSLFSIL